MGGPLGLHQVSDRLRGAEEAIASAPGSRLEIIETSALSVIEGRSAGKALLERVIDERPDAVFCANDLLAIGVLQAFTMLGDLRVPDDIALIGYDDIDFAQSAVVPLSSIRQPTSKIGEIAVDLLLAAADHSTPANPVLQPSLVARASTCVRAGEVV